jgi:hypothetical protein
MKPPTLSRRVTLLGVGVLTAAALTVGTTAFADTHTAPKKTTGASFSTEAAKEARNKRIALAFMDLSLNQKQPQKAADLYLGDPYIQHNPALADGKTAYVTWAKSFIQAAPALKLDFKRVLATATS